MKKMTIKRKKKKEKTFVLQTINLNLFEFMKIS